MHDRQQDRGGRELGPGHQQPLATRAETFPSSHFAQTPGYGPDQEDEGINLLALWRVLVRRKWTIVAFFTIVLTAVVTATFLQTPLYRATLVMKIERQAEKVLDFQDSGNHEGWGAGAWDFYQTQYELLQSRSLAERVAERLNLKLKPVGARGVGRPSPWSWVTRLFGGRAGDSEGEQRSGSNPEGPTLMSAEQVLAGLTVEPIRDSRLVRLHYESADAELAARVVNAWAEAFISLNLERRLEASSYAREFLEEQLNQTKAKLEDSERELVAFARKEQIYNIDERQSITNHNLQDVNDALSKAEQERIKAEVLYRRVAGARARGLTRVLESDLIAQLKQTKASLEAEYQDNLKVYKPGYPKMISLASRIRDVQESIDAEIGNIRTAIKMDYDIAKAQEARLAEKLESLKSEVMELQNRSIQYNILKREVDTNRQLYEGLLQEYKEAGIAGGVGTNNVSVVDRAEVPAAPFKPSLRKNALLAVFLGLLGGIGLAFLFEHLDDTLKMPDDLERHLGLPVLGMIPRDFGGARDAQERNGRSLALVSQEDPRSAFAEAYRSVRTALQFSTSDGLPKVLLVTSAAPSEGKSTTALSLAIQFAEAGKRVLLVDADLRNPSLHRDLGMESSHGLTNYLAGDASPSEVSRPTTVANLFAVPTGPLPPNPAELIASAKMVSLVSLAAEKFDQVVIDCPPVLGLADALILGNLASGTILVVESGGTRRGAAQGALKRLRTANTQVVGSVLTKVHSGNGSHDYYSSDYYYYYSDGPPGKKRLAA
jgi:capsular exopolysaccharide synthesis family protein